MSYNREDYYVLSPDVRFRKEAHRCIFYTIDTFFYATDNLSIIHPDDVIFLLLFDGSRNFNDVDRDFSFLFDRDNVDSIKILENLKPQLHDTTIIVKKETLTDEEIKIIANRYDPRDFLIPRDQVFLNPRNLKLEAPLSVNFNVDTRCGFSCLYCYHPLSKIDGYISIQRLKSIFTEFKEMGIESVLLTGGGSNVTT